MARRVLVIGGGVAGATAADAAKEAGADVCLISEEAVVGYSRCGLPYLIGGYVKSPESLVAFPASSLKALGINVATEARVSDIGMDKVRVEYKDGKVEELAYDSLVIATGGRPAVPPVKGTDLRGVFTLRTIEDSLRICKALEGARRVAIIGAGFIGVELAENFVGRGLEVSMVEMFPTALRTILDEDMASIIHTYLERKGVKLILNKKLVEIVGGREGVEGVVAEAGVELKADLVVLATGVRPNSELAAKAKLEIGPTRGIKTDYRMRTSVENIYAAGDCVEVRSFLTGQPTLCQLGTAAIREARVAGLNAGGRRALYYGALGTAATKAFELQIGFTGLTEWQAKQAGLHVESARVIGRTRSHYYPGAERVYVKLIAEVEQGRVVGGQVIGPYEVSPRINMIAFAIQKMSSVKELSLIDSGYSPPLSEYMEPIARASRELLKRIG